jgi:hypothetical protein
LLFYFSFFEEKRSTFSLFLKKREIAVFSSLSHLQRQVQNCFGEPLHRPKEKKNFFFFSQA